MGVEQRVAAIVAQGRFEADPRHSFWSDSLRSIGMDVIEVEIVDHPRPSPMRVVASRSGIRWTVCSSRVGRAAQPIVVETATGRFLESSDTMIRTAVMSLRGVLCSADLLVGIDLIVSRHLADVLPAVPLVYDAHEVFVEGYDTLDTVPLSEHERSFWRSTEVDVCRAARVTVTVSPGIADHMERATGVRPRVVPNYQPLSRGVPNRSSAARPVRFVLVGRAEPMRGLEQLAATWRIDPAVATLHLFMPPSRHLVRLRQLAKSRQHARDCPVFMPPVPPLEIPTTLADYDVGVVPYDYPYPYSEASPNKFGEYISAGLSVLAQGDGFVARTVVDRSIGRKFRWDDPADFIQGVLASSEVDDLRARKSAAHVAFREELNWDSCIAPVLSELVDVLRSVPRSPLPSRELGDHWTERATLREWLAAGFIDPALRLLKRFPVLRRIGIRVFGLATRRRRAT